MVWCTDFKGKFRVNRRYCYPLTITDAWSRFLIRCEPLAGETLEESKRVYESAFREHGVPLRMRSDNGTPFASVSVGGRSRLSLWWIELGTTPERIDLGRPERNDDDARREEPGKVDDLSRPMCVPCAQTKVSPMRPVVQGHGRIEGRQVSRRHGGSADVS